MAWNTRFHIATLINYFVQARYTRLQDMAYRVLLINGAMTGER